VPRGCGWQGRASCGMCRGAMECSRQRERTSSFVPA